MTNKSTISTDVEIFDKVYHVRGEKDSEHLQQCAGLVDRTMREVERQVSTVDTAKIAILAALNLADELMECRKRQEGETVKIKEKVSRLTGELEQALEG